MKKKNLTTILTKEYFDAQMDKRFGIYNKAIDNRFKAQDKKIRDGLAMQDKKMEEGFAMQDKKIRDGFAMQDKKIKYSFSIQDKKIKDGFAMQDKKMEEGFKTQDKSINRRFQAMQDGIDFKLDPIIKEQEENKNFRMQVMDTLDWLVGAFKKFDEEHSILAGKYRDIHDRIDDHEERIGALEQSTATQ